MSQLVCYRPFRFFAVTFAITWSAWFAAAYVSHLEKGEAIIGLLMLLGLLGPVIAAFGLTSAKGELRRDIRQRLFRLSSIAPAYWLVAVFLVPGILVVSILLSPLIGQSLDQLQLSPAISIMDGRPLFSLVIIFLAPAMEELGWSSYGIDSLQQSGRTILNGALLFGVLWSLWHLPLFFIEGYYHYRLLAENPLFAANFFISVVPLAVITNWLYFKNGRSIPLAIVFHVSAVLAAEMFLATQETKCLVTLVCIGVAVFLVRQDTPFFFSTKAHLAS